MAELWQHQRQAYELAYPRQAFGLFMGVGTGKTRVALHLIANKPAGHTLVVCPKSVLEVWQEQAALYEPELQLFLVEGSLKRRMDTLTQAACATGRVVVVINYEAVWRASMSRIRNIPWVGIVLDESHRIKSPGAKVSRFLIFLGKHAVWRLCLTATPMHNSPLDIYGQFRFLDQTVFGTRFDHFKQRYAVWGGFENRQVMRYINLDEMRERMASLSFMIDSDDALDLPDYVITRRVGHFEPGAARAYSSLKREFLAEIGQSVVIAGNALTKLLRLQEMTSGYATVEGGLKKPLSNAKRALLEDTLQDLPLEKSIVIFCRFRYDIEQARQICLQAGRAVYELSGAANETRQWKASGGVLVAQIQAGGLGVDLTKADMAIYYSLGFSLGEYEQSRGRLRRPGQSRFITYIHLVIKGTVDEYILRAFERKQDPILYIVQALKEDNRVPQG